MFGRRRPDAAYRRSNAVTGLPVQPTDAARRLVQDILEGGDDHLERQRLAQLLVDELSDAGGMPHCAVVVADKAQVHDHNGTHLTSKTYGYYRCWFEQGRVSRSRIRIYHRTAVRQQVIKPKVFLNTVLHEWVHHFDFAGMGMTASPHTSGFYARLRSLATELQVGFVLPPEPDRRPLRMTG